MLDRDEDMVTTGGRHPFLCCWKVGFTDQGVLNTLKMDLYANSGCTLDLSASVVERAMFSMDNAYKFVKIIMDFCSDLFIVAIYLNYISAYNSLYSHIQ